MHITVSFAKPELSQSISGVLLYIALLCSGSSAGADVLYKSLHLSESVVYDGYRRYRIQSRYFEQ